MKADEILRELKKRVDAASVHIDNMLDYLGADMDELDGEQIAELCLKVTEIRLLNDDLCRRMGGLLPGGVD